MAVHYKVARVIILITSIVMAIFGLAIIIVSIVVGL